MAHLALEFINHPVYQSPEIKTLYNRDRQRQFGVHLPIHIFGTGSDGNSVYLKAQKTLIDIGLPYSRYVDYDPNFFFDVNYIMVTHHHGDHLNPGTLLNVMKNHPHIKVIMLPFMYKYITSAYYKPQYKRKLDLKGNQLYEIGPNFKPIKSKPLYELDQNGNKIIEALPYKEPFELHGSKIMYATHKMTLKTHEKRTFEFNPLTTKHGDIVNMAIEIHDPELDFDFLYASDLDDLNGQRAFQDYLGEQQHITGLNQEKQYNMIFLEANYDEEIVNVYLDNLNPEDSEYRNKKARVEGNMRHISEQESFKYIERALTVNGYFVPLHASSSFGTLFQ